jgi:CRISPR/Cas system type I-B associated protein Csh2 (Cas7 group RAMP superfamily)
MRSEFSTSDEPVPAPIEKRLDFSDPRDKRDISKARVMMTRSRMKNLTREQIVELYEDAYWQAKNRPPPPLDDVATRQIGEILLELV